MVQRYNPDYVMHAARFEAFAREAEHGEFVKFSDYEALVSELASSRQINAQNLQVKLTMAETIKEQTDRVNALAVENAALINSSVCTLQDGRPQHGFYASEWFIAKLKNGQYAALKALPEEYSHDYRTNDGTYYTKDWVVGWMQTPDTEYRPNVKTPTTDAALAAIQAQGVEKAASALDALSAQAASATTQANFRAAAVYLRAEVLPVIGEAK